MADSKDKYKKNPNGKTMLDLTDNERRAVYAEIVKNWDIMETGDLALKTNLKDHVVASVAAQLRKAGIPLKKKGGYGFLRSNPNFLEELKRVYEQK